MPRFVVILRLLALSGLLLLMGCASLNLGTAARMRGLDYLNDDIASLVLAFDVPLTLEPVPRASLFRFDVSVPDGEGRHIAAVLEHGDAIAAAATLPPPAAGRTYYLFAFSEADKAALREAQAWARELADGGVAPPKPRVAVAPFFCSTAAFTDLQQTRISVLVALPGGGPMAPLIDDAPVAELLAGTGSAGLPVCAGHSG